MQLIEFGNCCTAKIIQDLGGDNRQQFIFTPQGKRVDISTYENYRDNYGVPELKRILLEREKYERNYRPAGDEGNGDLTNLALVFATVNAYQEFPRKFLKDEVGFRSTRKEAKGAHPERELYGHFASGECLQNWLNDNRDKG